MPRSAESARGHWAALVRPAALAIILESSLYSAVVPLLPHYRDELGLSTFAVGILSAAYAAGTVVGAITGGIAAGRWGPRPTVAAGFGLLGGGVLVFGLSGAIAVLDVARVVQGFGSGLVWSGLLAWLLSVAPSDRRGRAIGGAMGAGIFGSLFGPALGTAAVATSPSLVFGVVAAACVLLARWVLRLPAPSGPTPVTRWRSPVASRPLIRVILISLLPGAILGSFSALVPLMLSEGGFDASAVGATFLVSAALAAAMSPVAGWATDRHGRLPLIVGGLALTAPGLAAIGLVDGPLAIAALMVATFGLGVMLFSVPLTTLLSEVAHAAGVSAGIVAAMLNLTFSVGETVGTPASAFAADAWGKSVPFLVLAALALVAIPLLVSQRQRSVAG